MSVKVMYKNDILDEVEPFLLDALISSKKIKRFLRAEGWADVAADPIRGHGGSYGGPERRKPLAAIVPAISELSEEKAPGELHPGYAIVEALRTPIAVLDPDLRILLASRSFYEFFRITPRQTLGRSVMELWDRRWDTPELRSSLEKIVSRKSKLEEFEIEHEFSDKMRRTILLSACSMYPEEGIHMILLSFEDITEQNKIERELAETKERFRRLLATVRNMTSKNRAANIINEYSKELEQCNKEMDQFASIISHDLQSPLRVISTFSERLRQRYRDSLDETANKYISLIFDSTQFMRELIRDLHHYSRVARGKPFEPVDCNNALNKALSYLNSKIRQSGAIITADELPVISADLSQLIQVFQNLVDNSIIYRNKDKPLRVHISAERKDDNWMFRVADNGIGIDPKDFKRIFEIFQRLHTREEYPGTGIGLAICKKIVERHGGTIWVESTPGKGATFFFMLPTNDL